MDEDQNGVQVYWHKYIWSEWLVWSNKCQGLIDMVFERRRYKLYNRAYSLSIVTRRKSIFSDYDDHSVRLVWRPMTVQMSRNPFLALGL